MDSDGAIFQLASSLTGLPRCSSFLVRDNDGCFNFVSMLTAGSTTSRGLKLALLEQLLDRKGGKVCELGQDSCQSGLRPKAKGVSEV